MLLFIAFSDTILNEYDRILIVLDAAQLKLMGYLISVILQLGMYCTLGSNLMNQVNVKRLLFFIMFSCSLFCVDLSKERLIIPLASFYAFIILFYAFIISFLFLNFFSFHHLTAIYRL